MCIICLWLCQITIHRGVSSLGQRRLTLAIRRVSAAAHLSKLQVVQYKADTAVTAEVAGSSPVTPASLIERKLLSFPLIRRVFWAVVLLPIMGYYIAKTRQNDPAVECQSDGFCRVLGER